MGFGIWDWGWGFGLGIGIGDNWKEKEAKLWELRIKKENLKRKLGEENKEKVIEKLKTVRLNRKRMRKRKEKWRKFEGELKDAGENVEEIFSYALKLIPEKKPIDGVEVGKAETQNVDPDVNLHPENEKSLQNVRQKSDSGLSLLGSDNHYMNNESQFAHRAELVLNMNKNTNTPPQPTRISYYLSQNDDNLDIDLVLSKKRADFKEENLTVTEVKPPDVVVVNDVWTQGETDVTGSRSIDVKLEDSPVSQLKESSLMSENKNEIRLKENNEQKQKQRTTKQNNNENKQNDAIPLIGENL